MELGWQYLSYVRTAIDTSRVDIRALEIQDYPSDAIRKKLTSDGIFYLATNARKKMIYLVIQEEIHRILALFRRKCTN